MSKVWTSRCKVVENVDQSSSPQFNQVHVCCPLQCCRFPHLGRPTCRYPVKSGICPSVLLKCQYKQLRMPFVRGGRWGHAHDAPGILAGPRWATLFNFCTLKCMVQLMRRLGWCETFHPSVRSPRLAYLKFRGQSQRITEHRTNICRILSGVPKGELGVSNPLRPLASSVIDLL